MGPPVTLQWNTALLSSSGLAGTPLCVSIVVLGGKECSDCLQDVQYVFFFTRSFCFVSQGSYQTTPSVICVVSGVTCASLLKTCPPFTLSWPT